MIKNEKREQGQINDSDHNFEFQMLKKLGININVFFFNSFFFVSVTK